MSADLRKSHIQIHYQIITMTETEYTEAVQQMEGLEQPMVEALKGMAGKLTSEQREDAIRKLQQNDEAIISTLEAAKQHVTDAMHEITQKKHEIAQEVEDEERSNEVSAASSDLDQI